MEFKNIALFFVSTLFSGCAHTHTQIIPLWSNWDDAVSWDTEAKADWPNPNSNPSSELLIGDSRIFYKMPNLRSYFRFTLDLPKSAEIISAKLILHCSAGGKTKPKLRIHYINARKFSFVPDPWNLPLSTASVPWEKEKHDWNWKTHSKYETPDFKELAQDWLKKYGGFGDMGIVIVNEINNQDNFKGICSFDDEPERAAKLIIRYH